MSYPPPYGQGPPGPEEPYGSQHGGYPPPGWRIEHPQGTTVLVLGILSLVVCGILGPFAWSMGNRALTEIDAQPNYYSNRGSVVAGRICGIIATILLIIGVVILVLVLGLGVAVSSN
ncbi:MAG TPA: DUF4190 domain-containing protein [Jatrophihabitans sp.]|nr:DUF4190 domain-containing protein [Jatrophihabitans sp.]